MCRQVKDLCSKDGTIISAVSGYWASSRLRHHTPGEHFELTSSYLPKGLVFVPNVGELANLANDYRGIAEAPNAEFYDVFDENNDPTLRMALRITADISRHGMVLVDYGKNIAPGRGLPRKQVYEADEDLLFHALPGQEVTCTTLVDYWGASALQQKKYQCLPLSVGVNDSDTKVSPYTHMHSTHAQLTQALDGALDSASDAGEGLEVPPHTHKHSTHTQLTQQTYEEEAQAQDEVTVLHPDSTHTHTQTHTHDNTTHRGTTLTIL